MGTDNVALNQNIGGSTEQKQVFDRITAHNHQLPLPINGEGIDDSKPRLSASGACLRSPACRHNTTQNPSKNSQ